MGRLQEMERAIGKTVDIVSFYQTWGDRDEDEFPRALLRHTAQHGALPMITWEPWLTQFERDRGRSAYASRTDLRAIAAGEYDAYIRRWAREAAVYGRVLLLRFAHEMNNPQYPWSLQAGNPASDYIAAWRHVWTLRRFLTLSATIFAGSCDSAGRTPLAPDGREASEVITARPAT